MIRGGSKLPAVGVAARGTPCVMVSMIMSFIFEWIYNGFSSVLQFLGKANILEIYHMFQIFCISSSNLNIISL